jgi:Arc/MetJ-type ribon-helix-helix transcriptional regulator
VKVNVSIPSQLADRIEQHIKKNGAAMSVADFLRQAGTKEIDYLEELERTRSMGVRFEALPAPGGRRHPNLATAAPR